MRRAAPALPISPKLLKHFAAATLAITAIIAILADGSTTEAVAEQVKANELKKTEVDMLGAHKVARSKLRVKADLSSVPVEDGESDFGSGGSVGSVASGSDDLPMMVLPPAAGPGQSPAQVAGRRPGPRQARPQPTWPSATPPPRPTAEQRAQLIEISRQRSGSGAASAF